MATILTFKDYLGIVTKKTSGPGYKTLSNSKQKMSVINTTLTLRNIKE